MLSDLALVEDNPSNSAALSSVFSRTSLMARFHNVFRDSTTSTTPSFPNGSEVYSATTLVSYRLRGRSSSRSQSGRLYRLASRPQNSFPQVRPL